MQRRHLIAYSVIGALLCSHSALAQTSAPVVSAAEVHIQDYKFSPAQLTIKAGTTVKWINLEKRSSHSILFTGSAGLESERMLPGDSWQRRFDQPGRYEYSCGPHPEMKGHIEVTP